ncbi:hypothetical protein [Isobaculum melis]|uniref:Uncharacterized protein n=1 Tax=Isobaculum melis TaxID=142588 RepID=A0A1H9SBA3_9LACT|nr:hypothetical protein [Isobaculum melis]SER82300.1 hypothetical protein SAMN04488559_10711 [Isobaculum melis]
MENQGLNLFGEKFMKEVRDASFKKMQWLKDGQAKAPAALLLQEQLKRFTDEEQAFIFRLIKESVDETIFNTLFFFEENQEAIEISVEGQSLVELSDGLAGELFSEDGWIAKYSEVD